LADFVIFNECPYIKENNSTVEALTWDTAFKNINEPSGWAMKGIHEEAYQ
jgi:hypothetical protein